MSLYRTMNMARKAHRGKATSLLLFNSLRGCYRDRFHPWWQGRGRDHAGQAKEKGCAKTKLALTADIPTMGMNDVFGDCQPQPGPPGFSRASLVDAIEAL